MRGNLIDLVEKELHNAEILCLFSMRVNRRGWCRIDTGNPIYTVEGVR